MVALFGEDMVYCEERKSFYVWSGKRWQKDDFRAMERVAEKAMISAYGEAALIGDYRQRETFLRFIKDSQNRGPLSNMIHTAKRKVRGVSVTEFDADPSLLNVANGVVNLQTGKLSAHSREAMCSKMIPIDYNPKPHAGSSPRFWKESWGEARRRRQRKEES